MDKLFQYIFLRENKRMARSLESLGRNPLTTKQKVLNLDLTDNECLWSKVSSCHVGKARLLQSRVQQRVAVKKFYSLICYYPDLISGNGFQPQYIYSTHYN